MRAGLEPRRPRLHRFAHIMKKPLEVLHLYPSHDYTLHGAFASRAEGAPERPYMLFQQRVWSWREAGDAIGRIADIIKSSGKMTAVQIQGTSAWNPCRPRKRYSMEDASRVVV